MNARSQLFDLTVDGRQADEALASIFHTVLFHRTQGKFSYTTEGNYSISTIGYTDIDCDFIDLTYVCLSSRELDRTLKREIGYFSEQLRGSESSGMGQISLEFFQKKPRSRWLFQPESIVWEVWTVRLELISLASEYDRLNAKEKVGAILSDKIFTIAEIMNRPDYLPKMPSYSELNLIFDTSYQDVQPYLFKMNYSVSGPSSSSSSVGSTVKKIIKETLYL